MTTKQLIETIFKMLAFILAIYAFNNALTSSYYFFIDFSNMKEAQNHFLASSLSMFIAPLLMAILLYIYAPFLTQKTLPKEDKSKLLFNISAYDLQVILLFTVAIAVTLSSITPLISFSIEYFLTDKKDVALLYHKAQIIGNFITILISLALAFSAKTLIGWIRYMRYWYNREDEK